MNDTSEVCFSFIIGISHNNQILITANFNNAIVTVGLINTGKACLAGVVITSEATLETSRTYKEKSVKTKLWVNIRS